METNIPETGTIEQPSLWRLALQVDRDALRAVMWSTVEESTLVHFSVPFDPTFPLVKAIEEAVYATPVLLSDFGKIDVVVRTHRFLPLRKDTDEDLKTELLNYCRLITPDDEAVVRTDSTASDSEIIWAADSGVMRFLARTFRNPCVSSHIAILSRYFSRRAMLGNSGKVYVHFHQGADTRSADIIAYGTDGRPALMTTKTFRTNEDALYYILASLKEAGLDPHADEILLCGNTATRDEMMPLLRRYVSSVMPVIFPSAAFRAGRQALSAPFPLVILPLCE